MMRLGLVLLACCLVGVAYAGKARFDNYVVYRVVPNTREQLTALKQLQKNPDGVNFWSEPHKVGNTVDIMVPPHKQPVFQDAMKSLKTKTEVFIGNLQENIDKENPTMKQGEAMDWTSYHRLEQIYAWLDDVIAQNPEVTGFIVGRSFEGRQIRGVKVSYGTNKSGVFLEGGIHANEWIAPATVTYILKELLTSTDPAVRAIAEAYDWYIVPSVNVDGYEYSHTTDRTWRKTRSRPADGGLCFGADPNRNWDFHWFAGGSSNDTCSSWYAGSSPFSEIEIKSLSEYITSIADKIDVYLAFHSYSQMFLIPYGLTSLTNPNFEQHVTIGKEAAAALERRYGTKYKVGNVVELLYEASGSSMDWVKGTLNTTLVFTYELRDTDTYILPANQIVPTGEETLDSVISILNDALSLDKNRQEA